MAVNESILAKQEKEEIESICDRRGIQKLIHFTQLGNLESILEKEALIPVQFLEGHVVEVNDTGRFDNHRDSLSLSVEFPNYGMFYKYRQEKAGTNWVVLSIDRSVLWKLDCAFYHENAATSTVSTTSASDFKNVESFKAMFRDVEYKGVTVLRDELSIPDHFSTNPQAEVLCFSEIPLKYIDKVICKTYSEEQSLDGDSQELTVSQNRDYFGPRADYEIWKVIRRAEAGEPEFQTKLGSYYQKGNYVSNDLKEAASWYEKGARGGNAMAKNQLGYFYFQGEGVERNFELAAKLFLEAARAGSTVAQYNVGFCYEHGKGVDEDLSSARSWYQQAAEDGHQPAKDRLKEMEGNGTDFEDDLPF